MNRPLIDALKKIRLKKPLIINLTNAVTSELVANTLLAIGAAPIMSEATDELDELLKIGNALIINIGTLHSAFTQRCQTAIQLANYYHVPIILDPVGAGATPPRTKVARELMRNASIIRGNASEILALCNDTKTKGVESLHKTHEAKEAAKKIAEQYQNTVVISGETDFITNGYKENNCHKGSPVMAHITGMGCSMSAVLAAFRSIMDSSYHAASLGTHFFGYCGSLAGKRSQSPGSFRTHFIDYLYNLGDF